jgi:hypothetical protein
MDPPSGKTYVVDPGVFGSETPILGSLELGVIQRDKTVSSLKNAYRRHKEDKVGDA